MKRAITHTALGLVSLFLLAACSSTPHTASFNSGVVAMEDATGNSCTQLGYLPGTSQYNDCMQNERIREEVIARKAFNGNKNQPDGVMAQTYGKRMGLSINCTSYSMHTPGAPTLCD